MEFTKTRTRHIPQAILCNNPLFFLACLLNQRLPNLKTVDVRRRKTLQKNTDLLVNKSKNYTFTP